MSNEKKLQFNALYKLLFCVVFAFLYAWAGMEMKFLRRFIAPIVLCSGMFYFSGWNWKAIVQLPLMFLSLSMGYGSNNTLIKIFLRGLFGLTNGITSSGYNILNKKWLLVGTQIILLIGAQIIIGVYNPFPNARIEEMFLGLLIPLIPIFSVEDK